MKAAVVRQAGARPEILPVSLDRPADYEVLVQVRACGICRSDLTFAEYGIGATFPAVFGHEIAGEVVEVGREVTSVAAGDHVIATLIRSCLDCPACFAGHGYRCERRDLLSRPAQAPPKLRLMDGTPVTAAMGTAGFSEQALIHENQLVRIPPSIPMTAAAILGCSTLTGAGSVLNIAEVRSSASLAVFGIGGVGMNAINAAALTGISTIVAVDLREDSLRLAHSLGATHTVSAAEEDVAARVRDITDGGAQSVLEFVGSAGVISLALNSTARGGSLYLGGIPSPQEGLALSILSDVVLPRRSIIPIYMGFSNPQRDLPNYVDLYLSGKLLLDQMITKSISLDDLPSHLDSGDSFGPGRTVIVNEYR